MEGAVKDAIEVKSKVNEPNEEVKLEGAVNSAVTTCVATMLPRPAVASNPDNATAYSTPQPEFPHSCLPQPSWLAASKSPTELVKVEGAVND